MPETIIVYILSFVKISYNVNWYEMSTRAKKLLIVIMMRSAEPCKLTAGKIYDFSMENFAMLQMDKNVQSTDDPSLLVDAAVMSKIDGKIVKACHVLRRESKELYLTDRVIEAEGRISPLDFYRDHVSKNLPLLIKNGVRHWRATGKWDFAYFRETMPDKQIIVAVTPNGYADAIATDDTGKEYFVQPEERTIGVAALIDEFENPTDDEVYYVQRQNSNFETDYSELWRDVERDLPWATEAFGKDPDAINFWMGDRRAITSMHKDPYENIYCVIAGEKEFILHPPTDLPWITYGRYPSATYKRLENKKWIVDPATSPKSDIPRDDEEGHTDVIPWVSVDPLRPDYERYPLYKNATTVRVKVEAGDVLYLPSLWFHHVRQSHGCVAINYWYDMEYDIKYAYHTALQALCE